MIDLPEALDVLGNASLLASSDTVPPKDNLSSTILWQLEVQYQVIATQDKQYQGCLFGDSITAELGTSLGDKNFNFALNGLSAISLFEQLQSLIQTKVKCDKVVIAIGGNDAWYGISNELFVEKLQKALALGRSLGTQQFFFDSSFLFNSCC
ncbi:MAG: SGNH/GDSL hydrolase family protein [Coleofasciculaceae cyanobacterium]